MQAHHPICACLVMSELGEEEKKIIGQRIMSLHEGQSRAAFAKELGISDSTLGNYERGDRFPDAHFLARLRGRYGVDLNWLITDHLEPATGTLPRVDNMLALSAEEHSRLIPKEAVKLPRYDIQASAGRGTLVLSEKVEEYLTVGRDWLRRNLPPWAPPNAVVGVLEGSGDSMEPTIRDGDLIMVVQDINWRIVERGGVFVFSLDRDRLLLKRLEVMINGDLSIISDNKSYATQTIPFADIPHRIIVHGQVFFVGGKPRSF